MFSLIVSALVLIILAVPKLGPPVTFAVFATIAEACALVIPVLAVFAAMAELIALASLSSVTASSAILAVETSPAAILVAFTEPVPKTAFYIF